VVGRGEERRERGMLEISNFFLGIELNYARAPHWLDWTPENEHPMSPHVDASKLVRRRGEDRRG
jgi:hypothetical protein